MKTFAEHIRSLRKQKGDSLRVVSAYLDIDQAILSKIERGKRKATRKQLVKLAEYYKVDESELLILWLSDKIAYDVESEDMALKALQVAEEKVEYLSRNLFKINRKEIISKLKTVFSKFNKIEKAWIYGSFARKDDKADSDIDIAIKTDETISYFDLAEIQYLAEKMIKRKVDIGFIDTFKPYIWENVVSDLKLIYER
ncbi:MAG: hypothetical protein A2046_07765 [Bacteroidetes bacterium GWA2_30_7]|nr:MAG: hypothetical protein A2046_07765 [Bacteroidetes bacterium GWA2_30_7]